MDRTLLTRIYSTFIQFLIIYSVVTYLVEVEYYHTTNSKAGPLFFLWSERVVATIFTLEYLVNWWYAKRRALYPFTGHAIIDLLSIVPFWIGFYVASPTLQLIRTLRVLRLLKLYHHNEAMRLMVECLIKARHQLLAVMQVVLVVLLLGAVVMREVEGPVQPDKFGSVANSAWYVFITLSTIGYGDAFPITPLGKVVASFIILIGLGIMGTFIGIFSTVCSEALKKFRATHSE